MKWFTLHKELTLGILVLLLYLLPNWLFLEMAKFLVHDNLDSNVVWFKNLVTSGTLFAKSSVLVPNALGGIPRGLYPSEVNVIPILHFFFKPFVAYNLNIIIIHFIAFIGVWLLASQYFFKGADQKKWSVWIALCFALIPFWPSGGITIAGQPLLLFAFLNLLAGIKSKQSWSIIVLYPLYSSLVFGNMFVMLAGFLVFIIYSIKEKKLCWQVILAFFIFTGMSVLAEYRLFQMYFTAMPDVQRDTWMIKEGNINWKGVIGITSTLVFKGAYHFFGRVFPFLPIIGIVGFYLANKLKKKKLIIIFCGIVLCSIPTVIRSNYLVAELFPFLHVINPRFVVVHTFLWLVLTMTVIPIIIEKGKLFKVFVSGVLCFMVISHFLQLFKTDYQGSDYIENSFYQTFFDQDNYQYKTFNSYYKVDAFEHFANATKGQYEGALVVTIDIKPEAAQFNGYHTLGGYYAIYPRTFCEKYLYLTGKDINGICPSRCYFTMANIDNGLVGRLISEKVQLIFSTSIIQDERLEPILAENRFYVYKL
jgi:hypothetical protein